MGFKLQVLFRSRAALTVRVRGTYQIVRSGDPWTGDPRTLQTPRLPGVSEAGRSYQASDLYSKELQLPLFSMNMSCLVGDWLPTGSVQSIPGALRCCCTAGSYQPDDLHYTTSYYTTQYYTIIDNTILQYIALFDYTLFYYIILDEAGGSYPPYEPRLGRRPRTTAAPAAQDPPL